MVTGLLYLWLDYCTSVQLNGQVFRSLYTSYFAVHVYCLLYTGLYGVQVSGLLYECQLQTLMLKCSGHSIPVRYFVYSVCV